MERQRETIRPPFIEEESVIKQAHACQVVIAQRLPPKDLILIYGEKNALKIAINILCPPLSSHGQEVHSAGSKESLINQLVSGTPNYNYNPNDSRSYLLELESRLKTSTSILENLGELPEGIGKSAIEKIAYLWKERLLSTTKGDGGLEETLQSLREQIKRFGNLTGTENDCDKLFNDFERTIEKLPEITASDRRNALEEIGINHYGMELPEALEYFEKYKEKLIKDTAEFKFPPPVRIKDVINLVYFDYKILLGEDIDLMQHVVLTTPQEDPNLLTFPAYYWPGRGVFFNKENPVTLETFQLAYHEMMHLVIDMCNQKSAKKEEGRELALHRSVPDPMEEGYARIVEERAIYLAGLMGIEGDDPTRQRTMFYRAMADVELNIEGKSLREVRSSLREELPKKTADMIANFVDKRPGNYLFGYVALPEKLREIANSKNLRSTQMMKALLEKVKEGGSWKKDVVKVFENLPYGGAYAELENLPEDSPWRKLKEIFRELPEIDFEKRLALARYDPYHALQGQDTEVWHEILTRLINTNMEEPEKKMDTNASIDPEKYEGATKLFAFLEEDAYKCLIESVRPKAFYSLKENPEDPRDRILGQFEIVFLFSLDESLKKDPEMQTLLLEYIHNTLTVYHTDRLAEEWPDMPAYRLRKAASYAKELSIFMRNNIDWDLSLQEKVSNIYKSLENTAYKFEKTAEIVVKARRTRKEVFEEYVETTWGMSVEEIVSQLNAKIKEVSINPTDWHDKESRADLTRNVLELDRLAAEIGLPFTTQVRLTPSGGALTLAGAAYVLPTARMNLTPELGNIPVEQVARGITERELKNMSLEELQTLTIVNIVDDMAQYILLFDLLKSEEVEITQGDYYKKKTKKMEVIVEALRTRHPNLPSETLNSVLSYLKLFQDKVEGKNGSNIRTVGEKGEYAHSINFKNSEKIHTRKEWQKWFKSCSEPMFQLASSLPSDHLVSDMLKHFDITKNAPRALGGKKDGDEIFTAMKKYYANTSTTLWIEDLLSKEPIRQPLLPIFQTIVDHETLHGAFQAAKQACDPGFRLASSCHYSPSFESFPTYLAYRRQLNLGNAELANKYLLFNLLRAKADIILNHGHQPMAKVWESYSKYIPKGGAAERVQRYTESLRNKPGSGLFYVGDFEAWDKLYHYFRSEISLNEQETYQALLLFSRYRPQKVLQAMKKYPEEAKTLKEIFLQK